MKLIILFFSLSSFALEVGDLILQPLHCSLCSAIEQETDSIYSHIGIIIQKKPLLVAEAFEKVRIVSIKEFLNKTQKKQKIKILRSAKFKKVNRELFIDDFYSIFLGKEYDSKFLWSHDKIYCSELIYKLFKLHRIPQPEPAIMKFNKARKFWDNYYDGNIPKSELGISPADYDESPYFKQVIIL